MLHLIQDTSTADTEKSTEDLLAENFEPDNFRKLIEKQFSEFEQNVDKCPPYKSKRYNYTKSQILGNQARSIFMNCTFRALGLLKESCHHYRNESDNLFVWIDLLKAACSREGIDANADRLSRFLLGERESLKIGDGYNDMLLLRKGNLELHLDLVPKYLPDCSEKENNIGGNTEEYMLRLYLNAQICDSSYQSPDIYCIPGAEPTAITISVLHDLTSRLEESFQKEKARENLQNKKLEFKIMTARSLIEDFMQEKGYEFDVKYDKWKATLYIRLKGSKMAILNVMYKHVKEDLDKVAPAVDSLRDIYDKFGKTFYVSAVGHSILKKTV